MMVPQSDDHPILNKVLLITEQFSSVRVSEVNVVRRILGELYGPAVRHGSIDQFYWRFPTTTILLWYLAGKDGVIGIEYMQSKYFGEMQQNMNGI